MTEKAALQIISSSKYKLTSPRAAILKAVFKIKEPFSAHDILQAIRKKGDSLRVDLATIYRNLPIFEELGLLCRSDFSDEMSRYLLAAPGHDHHHHHIICRKCEKIEPVDFCVLEGQEEILRRLGFSDIRHRLEFTGLCRSCA